MAKSMRPVWQNFKHRTGMDAMRQSKMDIGPILDEIYRKMAEIDKRNAMVRQRALEIEQNLVRLGKAFAANRDATQKAPGLDPQRQKRAADSLQALKTAIGGELTSKVAPAYKVDANYDVSRLNIG